MLATLTLAALMAQQPSAQTTNFAPKFTKDETMAYAVKVTGADNGTEVVFDVQFELTTTGEPKDGKTPCHIRFLKMLANFGGNEENMDLIEMDVTLDKFGSPTEMTMDGLLAVPYVALLTQYLPNKSMKAGDTYKADMDLGAAKIAMEGSYTGEEELEGKKYSVLTVKTILTPSGQDHGTLSTKSYYDASLGKVVKTESTIATPDGEFKLSVVAKPKKK